MTEQRAAIIGSGLIGRAWALVFARAGWQVRMTDPSAAVLADLPPLLANDCAILHRHGLCDDIGATLARISIAPDLAAAVADAAFVQENGPEDASIKRAIYAELDRLAPPGAILASSTSAIVASRFTEDLPGRARCLVGHPVNPPHLIPLVEICGAPWTDPAAIETARAVYTAIGQVPIIVRREIDGFVLNRLQGALLAEALRLLRDGIVSVEDLDRTVKDGLGLRWSFMGPFETIDMNAPGGVADYFSRYCRLYRALAGDPPGPEVFDPPCTDPIVRDWETKLAPNAILGRSLWRNERLAALRAHKREMDRITDRSETGT